MIKIHPFNPKSHNVAFVFSSKDRVELSRRTFPRLAESNGFDLYWFDGSRTPEGQQLPFDYAANLCAIHSYVVGGPDVAIAYSLKTLYDMGYEYIGLLENDILLETGWWPELLELFEKGQADGLNPGSVSGRAYTSRLLAQRDGYAVMNNHGAAMNFFHRDAVPIILDFYRTTTQGEMKDIIQETHNITSWEFEHNKLPRSAGLAADWMFEQALFLRGYHALALTPAKTENIDADMAKEFNLHKVKNTEIQPWHQANWDLLTHRDYQVPDAEDMFYRLRRFYKDEKSGWYVVMPHQLHTLLPDTFQGPWQHKWVQLFGPMAIKANEGCTMEIPHIPSSWGIIVNKDDAEAFNCEIKVNGETAMAWIAEFDDHHTIFMAQHTIHGPCTITVPPGAVILGITIAEFTPWMLQQNAFDITKWLPFVK